MTTPATLKHRVPPPATAGGAPATTRLRRVALVLTAGAALWCAASLIPAAHPLFSPVCHQLAGRSFHIAGAVLPVCARCTGLYLGFLAGSLGLIAFPLRARRRAFDPPPAAMLLAAAIPSLVEGVGEISGLWTGSALARCLTGALFGSIVPFFFIPAADEMLTEARMEISRLIIKRENAHADTGAR